MGKQRGGNVLLGSIGAVVIIIELVVIGLLFWGLSKWLMGATNDTSKGFAIFFMVVLTAITFRLFVPLDED
jgi:hypothetical protein